MESTAEPKKNTVSIYDINFNLIEVPVKIPSGKTIYSINKILAKTKRPESDNKARHLMNEVGKKIRSYFHLNKGENISLALQRAMMEAFSDGKLQLSDMMDMQAEATDDTGETDEYNRRLMLDVFIEMIDRERLNEFVPEVPLQQDLLNADKLYEHYPMNAILQAAANFLRYAGLR